MKPVSKATLLRFHPRSLGAALLVAALAGESYLMSQHNSVAAAREEVVSQSVPVVLAPPLRLPVEPACSQAEFDQAEQTLARLADVSSTSQIPLSQLKSNPFQQDIPALTGGGGAGTPAVARPQDNRAEVLNAVASLELESVAVSDTHRSCTINNVPFEEGQQVNGFTIETIANGCVTVSRGIYRFELTLRH
jgi:hypothetical protein